MNFSVKRANKLAPSYTGSQSRIDQQWTKIINPPDTPPFQMPIIEAGMIPNYLDSDHLPIGVMLKTDSLYKDSPNKAYKYEPIPITPHPPSKVLLECPLTTSSEIKKSRNRARIPRKDLSQHADEITDLLSDSDQLNTLALTSNKLIPMAYALKQANALKT